MCVHECSLCMQNVCVCGRARVSIPDLMWTVRFELNMPVLCAYPSPVGSLCRGCFNDDPYGRPLCVTPSRTSCPIKARQLRPLVWPPPPSGHKYGCSWWPFTSILPSLFTLSLAPHYTALQQVSAPLSEAGCYLFKITRFGTLQLSRESREGSGERERRDRSEERGERIQYNQRS